MIFGIPVIYFLVIALAAGSGGGWWVRDKFCDAATERAKNAGYELRIKTLQNQLAARDVAAEADRQTLAASLAETERLEGANRELVEKVSAGICFPADDASWVRKLWGTPTGGKSKSGGNPG